MTSLSLCIFLFCFFKFSLAGDPSQFKCTEEYCRNAETITKCSYPDTTKKCNNESMAVLVPAMSECSCCQTCFLFLELGDSCVNGAPGSPIPSRICGPGLKCLNQKCVKMDNLLEDPLLINDDYECENGQCFCVYRKGNEVTRIFGSFLEKTMDHEQVQCKCSRLAYKASRMLTKAVPFDGYQLFARCLPNGQFDPLQCIDGKCVCVDSDTGEYDKTAPPVPISQLGTNAAPYCYDEYLHNHTKTYYRECEKILVELLKARDYAEAEGYKFLFPFFVKCRPDGYFDEEPSETVKSAMRAFERTQRSKIV